MKKAGILIIITILFGLAACNPDAPSESPSLIDSTSPPVGTPVEEELQSTQAEEGKSSSEKYAELAEKYRDNPELFDKAVYAAEMGISMDEAIGRFELMDKAGTLGARLEEEESGTFTSLWIEHQPEFRIVISFSENGEETLKKYVEGGSPLAGVIELRTSGVTYEQLQAAQRETMRILDELDLFCDTSINIKENRVEVYLTDEGFFYETLREAEAELPEQVTAIVVYEPLREVPFQVNPDLSVYFPQLKMRSGSYMLALMTGELVVKGGYLCIRDSIIIWQADYFLNNNIGTIEILDRDRQVVARVGEKVTMGGGSIGSLEYINRMITEPLPLDCQGPFWLMGEIVSAD